MKTLSLLAVLPTLALTGCDVWFHGNQCDDDILVAAEDIADVGLLDPYTAQCVWQGGGGGGSGSCGADDPLPVPPLADFALCQSECTGLDETSCLAIEGCRAAYVGDCAEGLDCNSTTYAYAECWATAPSGPERGDCFGLDAYECSRHDDCVANHFPSVACDANGDCAPSSDPSSPANFESCAPEPVLAEGCYEDIDCPAGYTCDADVSCDPAPGCDPNTGCPPVCYGSCVPETSGSCYGEVFCDGLPPDCPPDRVPEIVDGCYSGACILLDQCESPLDCQDANTEAECLAINGCEAVYVGENCVCDPDGTCVCETQSYSACAAAANTP